MDYKLNQRERERERERQTEKKAERKSQANKILLIQPKNDNNCNDGIKNSKNASISNKILFNNQKRKSEIYLFFFF